MIACCMCGMAIEPNPPHNMCDYCLREHVDITAEISKEAVLQYCRSCERYLRPPGEWITAALESRQLLELCIKKLKGMKSVKLVDAGFVWTEPNSKRLKVKLTVSRDLSSGNEHQQAFVAEFKMQNQMCNDCHGIEAKKYWQSLVQVRQHAENKKTFYYIEQLIMRHKAHEHTLAVKPAHGGLNFYFASEHHARKLVEFMQAKVPVRCTFTKRFISHDSQNNSNNYKYTWMLEIAPVSKDSLVCLSKKWRQQLGNLSPICLIHKVSTGIQIIDPVTTRLTELTSNSFFRAPFEAIFNPKQLVEYVVMDVEAIPQKKDKTNSGQSSASCRHALCDVWLVRAKALGSNTSNIHTRSHLGHQLKIGDSVMGYNLREANLNNAEYNKLSSEQIPDVVLVRKCQDETQTPSSSRVTKRLTDDLDDDRSYQEFLQDLEDDSEYPEQSQPVEPKAKAKTVEKLTPALVDQMLEGLHLTNDTEQSKPNS